MREGIQGVMKRKCKRKEIKKKWWRGYVWEEGYKESEEEMNRTTAPAPGTPTARTALWGWGGMVSEDIQGKHEEEMYERDTRKRW